MKTSRAARYLCFVLILLLIVWSVVLFPVATFKSYVGLFTNKEGLQYLGASTSVVRDDLGWPTNDSLAEYAMRTQNRVTADAPAPAPAPVKASFSSRERMTPEEKLLQQQKK